MSSRSTWHGRRPATSRSAACSRSARRSGEAADDPAIDGVVVVQGTDTIEETGVRLGPRPHDARSRSSSPARCARRARRATTARPTCSTRSGRPARRPCGARASSVLLAGSIHAADDVAKTHASSLDDVPEPEPRAARRGGGRAGDRRAAPGRPAPRGDDESPPSPSSSSPPRSAMDGALLDAAAALGARGIVVAATGAGNTSAGLLEAGERAMAAGIPVVLVDPTLAGRARRRGYAFPGGGATWVRAGRHAGRAPQRAEGADRALARGRRRARRRRARGAAGRARGGRVTARPRRHRADRHARRRRGGRPRGRRGDRDRRTAGSSPPVAGAAIEELARTRDAPARARPRTRSAIPGLTDAHLHLADAAVAAVQLDLEAARHARGGPGADPGGARGARRARRLAARRRLGRRSLGRPGRPRPPSRRSPPAGGSSSGRTTSTRCG